MIGSQAARFINAAENGDLEQVKIFKERRLVGIDDVNEFGQTALIQVCKPRFRDAVNPSFVPSYAVSSPEQIFDYLLENGADPSIRENNGFSAIHHAAKYGKSELIEKILSKSPELVDEKVDQWTPLFFAVRFNKFEAAKTLIQRGASLDLEITNGDKKYSIFDYANRISVSEDREEMLTLLNSQITAFGIRQVSAEPLVSRSRSIDK